MSMKRLVFLIITIFITHSLQAQLCLGEEDTICPGESITISALCGGGSGGAPVFVLDSMQQVFLTDDQYSGVINIGFPFTFYGNVYNQLLISSNNYVTFDLSNANGYSNWNITASIPSPSLPLNTIMCPYQDINPSAGGTIEYGIMGTAPNRIFVVRYNLVPMFSCVSDNFCSSLLLYEGTNHIEVHLDNKPLCPSWNSGVAIEGVQDAAGVNGTAAPGRNYPTQWTASADAYAFTPTTPSNYNADTIPYVPTLSETGIEWWDTDGNFLGTGFEITVTPTNDTTGYYIVYNQCYVGSGGTANEDTAWVYHHLLPQIITTTTSINCMDSIGIAVAEVSGNAPFIYQWDDQLNQTTDTAINLSAGTYTITVIDSNGCVDQAIAIIDSAAYIYNALITDVSCNGDADGNVLIESLPMDSTLIFQWDQNAGSQTSDTAINLAAGNYAVYITDTIGCIDTIDVEVNEPLALSVISNVLNPSCNGLSDGSIMVNVSGGTPGYIYSWGSNQLVGLGEGAYPLTITDTNNCTYIDTFLITEPSAINTVLDSMDASCGLSDGLIIATTQGGTPGYTYTWSPGGLGTDTLNNIGAGFYTVIVNDINGCADTASTMVNEQKGYGVDFTITPNQGIIPLTVSFFNNSFNCTNYSWTFDNGNFSTLTSPDPEIYENAGSYTVTLIGCNSSGLDRCCDTITRTVTAESTSHCSWTNVITPNGDGFNDLFKINCDKIVEFDIVIFNRWGNEVFRSNDINISWDGTKNGTEITQGTYFFIINAKGIDDVYWKEKGTVTLIR
jgi:gliding motility-associated-like protein